MIKSQDLIVHRLKNKNYLMKTHFIEHHLKVKCIAILIAIHLTFNVFNVLKYINYSFE